MSEILIAGSANADLVLHADRMPLLGETITGYDFATNAGGKGLNQAVAVKKLGGDAAFMGCVGNDTYAGLIQNALRQYGIPFEGRCMPENTTGTAIVTVINGDNFIMLHRGANGDFSPAMVQEKADLIRSAKYLLLQLEIPIDTVIQAAFIAHSAGTKVILNPAPYQALPDELYPLIDYLIPNEHEAELMTGIPAQDEAGCRKAMDFMLKKGVGNALITLGERGCCCSDGKDTFFVPAVKADVVDTTSAGDTFIGALCCRLNFGDSLRDAAAYASKAAAITVSRSGAAVSIPYAREVL